MEDVVIIGGGIAGLSCLNALLDRGVSPLLLEGSVIGTPKMCGEFLAPKAVSCLQQWNIGEIQLINNVEFITANSHVNIPFQLQAGAMARSKVEIQLASRARGIGGRIREKTGITNIIPATNTSAHILHLSTGEIIEVKTVFIATGKYAKSSKSVQQSTYVGMKFHFNEVIKPGVLQMYSLPDCYLGTVPISNEISNSACLAKRSTVEKFGSPEKFLHQITAGHPQLNHLVRAVDFTKSTWLYGNAPTFGLKKNPNWPHTFWIGDAYASLYPAIGSGFAHGIESAITAVDNYFMQDQANNAASIKSKLRIGKLLNTVLLRPYISKFAIPVMKRNPWLVNIFMKRLDYA